MKELFTPGINQALVEIFTQTTCSKSLQSTYYMINATQGTPWAHSETIREHSETLIQHLHHLGSASTYIPMHAIAIGFTRSSCSYIVMMCHCRSVGRKATFEIFTQPNTSVTTLAQNPCYMVTITNSTSHHLRTLVTPFLS